MMKYLTEAISAAVLAWDDDEDHCAYKLAMALEASLDENRSRACAEVIVAAIRVVCGNSEDIAACCSALEVALREIK